MELTQAQVSEILVNEIGKPGGIDRLIQLVLEILMRGEREVHNAAMGDVSNGYRPRRLFTTGHTLELRVPRTRRHAFLPVVLGVLRSQREEMARLASLLFTQGSTLEHISEVMALLYGQQYSTSQIDRFALSAVEEVQAWMGRPLAPRYECVMIDASFVPTRRGDAVTREAYFVAMGLLPDGTRDIIGVYNNPTEGSSAWDRHFDDLKARGVQSVGLVVSDGLTGIEEAVSRAFPGARVQLCTVHLQRDLISRVRQRDRAAFIADLKPCFDAGATNPCPAAGLEKFRALIAKWGSTYPSLRRLDNPRLPRYFTFLGYDYGARRYIYTTNWVERFNRKIKQATRYKGALPRPDSPLYIIGSIAMRAEYLTRPIPALRNGLRWLGEGEGAGENARIRN